MKLTSKIYHILQTRLKKQKQGMNKNFLAGYRAALLDTMKVETEINKGYVDYKAPFVINYKGHDRAVKTFTKSV